MIIDSVLPEEKSNFGAPLIEGFKNLALSLNAIAEALEAHSFKNNFRTAVVRPSGRTSNGMTIQ